MGLNTISATSIPLAPVTPDAIAVLRDFLPRWATGDANHSAAALVTRAVEHETHYAVCEGRLLIRWRPVPEAPMMWMWPLGERMTETLFMRLAADAVSRREALRFWGTVSSMVDVVRRDFPSRAVDVVSQEDWWDYLYEREAFVTLSGRALHGKRNFVRRFYAAHPSARFVPMTSGREEAVRRFLDEWYRTRGELTAGLTAEQAAVDAALRHWNELDLTGGLLMEEDRVLGFTYGALVAPGMLAVHVEKAAGGVVGAYPALSQAFARTLPESVDRLNREEDLGLPGLRKAKSDWAPCAKNEKGWITVR